MTIRIYNTLTRKKEIFETIEPGKVRMYVCGPTVYAPAHIGHAMSAMVFDIIRRYLEYRGYSVKHVMNYTDVDDKIIQRANDEGCHPIELAERYIDEFRHHLDDLNIYQATINPRATEEINQIIQMVEELINEGYAYEAHGDVYFRVAKDNDYGKLSRRNPEDMQAGARIEIDNRKENPMDFALWKAAKAGEPAWESPWGKGRPGWHIECSAMSLAHLGEQIDIHGGGNDLIFPHHENEIAQTESLTKKAFARYWVHNGMLQLSGEKMSKSIGNLITISEFLSKHKSNILRMMVLNSSYRNPLTYNEDVIAQAERALGRLRSALRPAQSDMRQSPPDSKRVLDSQMKATKDGFLQCMDDDFNTAGALGHLFDLVRVINQVRADKLNEKDIKTGQALLLELTEILGLRLQIQEEGSAEVSQLVNLLIEVRSELRNQQLWDLTDLIRKRLLEMDILLEDEKEGTNWRWK
jgi:cysteinyl-tRNA synthetase